MPSDPKGSGPDPLWLVYSDGASKGNPGAAGAGWIIRRADHSREVKNCRFLGQATNNEAEYQALMLALQEALSLGAKAVRICLDSELLVRQLNGLYKVRSPALGIFFQKTRELLSRFSKYAIIHIPREENREADQMANLAIRDWKGAPGA